MAKDKEEQDKRQGGERTHEKEQQRGQERGMQQRGQERGMERQGQAMERRRGGMELPRGGMASPLSFMRRFTEDLDRLFADFGFGPMLLSPFRAREERWPSRLIEATWSPPMDVYRRDGRIVVRAEVPGLGKDDVNVEVIEDELVISGERKREQEERGEGWVHSERGYGAFCRTISLPEGVDPDKISARFDNGVLEIEVPVPEETSRSRRIEIREGAVH